ncbi:MAG: lipoyl synthase [Planctomycetes bacterium]|nr:lipoyl synthase [Planctomycetota bacterium]
MELTRTIDRPRFPDWLKKPLPRTRRGQHLEALVSALRLHTICEEARCPNRGECYERGTATFLILGEVCTRGCSFCAVRRGRPAPLDPDEPERIAAAVEKLALRHVVITSVTRDDLADGGARRFAEVIHAIRSQTSAIIEVLTSDFGGRRDALEIVLAERPEIFNHNLETVPRLYRQVRAGSSYERSLDVLSRAKEIQPQGWTKSGLMLGLGEMAEEVRAVLRDLREARCDLLTLGQYLQPTFRHHPVVEFIPPEVFSGLAREARALGFAAVFSGPYVRSSYMAERTFLEENRVSGV